MQSSLRLGRVAGIQIGINWSWLIVFALIVWSLSAAVFPAQNPGLGDAAYLVMALVASLLFFVSLVLHELGHAIQARRDGMRLGEITLWLFGGVAEARLALTQSLLGDLRVRDVMVDDPVTVAPEMTVRGFVDGVFAPHRHTAYPVVEGARAVGLMPLREIADLPPGQWDRATVAEHMQALEGPP